MKDNFYLLKHECPECKHTGEVSLHHAGPHIKQVCGKCGRYIKFMPKHQIPDIRVIRQQIWKVSKQNLEAIELAKKETGYVDVSAPLEARLIWWRVYFYLRTNIVIE